jgi:hypothetical protein
MPQGLTVMVSHSVLAHSRISNRMEGGWATADHCGKHDALLVDTLFNCG